MIILDRVGKEYATPAGTFSALREVSLRIATGSLTAVIGKSGSGKSTLLNLIGGLDRASSGTLEVEGAAVHEMSEARLSAWRGRKVGFVFQFFQLLPTLTAVENVMLPMDFAGVIKPRERRSRALELLDRTGIAEQASKLPSTLSGGQQQRVAIARALANDPDLLLADEPTGNLDSETAQAVFELFRGLGKTVIIATHERDLPADRTVLMADGRIVQ
ncbi:MAG TPA: ABC transporter ATP-binding protein [Myxococcales bacterium]|jgi:putative ABC transport system ATP-binding protein|nr:ABC transporter ATP-binding protein [Myxococcales bacterium]